MYKNLDGIIHTVETAFSVDASMKQHGDIFYTSTVIRDKTR
jgi:hypothetical protein